MITEKMMKKIELEADLVYRDDINPEEDDVCYRRHRVLKRQAKAYREKEFMKDEVEEV